MNARERIIAIHLSESIRRQPEYADRVGVSIEGALRNNSSKKQQGEKKTNAGLSNITT